MGLDMYIFRQEGRKSNTERNLTELAYWRKANQIRSWFVDHTDLEYEDDCKYIPLTRNNLENLVEDCQAVLNDHSLAEEIMPTQGGFFFGSTNYDEDYFQDLEYTVKEVTKILNTIPDKDFENGNICYYDWW